MRILGWLLPIAVISIAASSARIAAAETFVFKAADHQQAGVTFELDAPLSKIQATVPGLEGELVIESGRAKGRFRVRVEQIKTGIEGRDRDLRKPGWLDARRWPFIGFVFDGFQVPADLLDGKAHVLSVKGRLILHGVERVQTVEMTVRFDEKAGLLQCEGSFGVKLEDHRIQRSDSSAKKLIGLSVGEVATVKLRLTGRRG